MSGPPFKSPHNRIPRYRQILIKKKREKERDGALDEKNDAERAEEF